MSRQSPPNLPPGTGRLMRGFKYFAYGTQIAMGVLVPFIVCLWVGRWLQDRYRLGSWVMIAAIVLALILMAADLTSLFRVILKQSRKDAQTDLHAGFQQASSKAAPDEAPPEAPPLAEDVLEDKTKESDPDDDGGIK